MDLRFIPMALCFPCTVLLPITVWRTSRALMMPDWTEFLIYAPAVLLMVVVVEWGLGLAAAIWDEEVRRHPPDWKGARPDPIRLLSAAVLVLTQVGAMMTYATTMDGGVMFSAARWVHLAYGIPSAFILFFRRGPRSRVESLFLRWGWAPILALGVPLALPELKALGLVRGPLD